MHTFCANRCMHGTDRPTEDGAVLVDALGDLQQPAGDGPQAVGIREGADEDVVLRAAACPAHPLVVDPDRPVRQPHEQHRGKGASCASITALGHVLIRPKPSPPNRTQWAAAFAGLQCRPLPPGPDWEHITSPSALLLGELPPKCATHSSNNSTR